MSNSQQGMSNCQMKTAEHALPYLGHWKFVGFACLRLLAVGHLWSGAEVRVARREFGVEQDFP